MRLLLAAALLALHPLGNFTVNEYVEVHVSATAVDVAYVLDLAELPTVTEQPAAAAQAYPAAKCAELAESLTVTADGRKLALSSRPESLTLPTGAAGLPTLRLSCAFHAPADLHPGTKITVHNGAYAGTIGWHEIVANGAFTAADVPATSISNRLSAYPQGEQLDVRDAAFTVTADGQGALLPGRAAAGAALPDALTRQFDDLVGRRDLTLPIGALALLIAAVLGAAHAVAPGHGKTIMAAYLLGRRGQRRKAAGIAATVVATHTAGVLALGLLVAASFTFAPQSLYGWLAVLNGLIVAGIGVTLWRRARRGHLPHAHGPHGHSHGGDGHHEHSHHGHGHHGHGPHQHRHHQHGPEGHGHAFPEQGSGMRDEQDEPGLHEHHHAHPGGGAAVLVAPAPVRELAEDAGPGWRSVLAMGFAGGMTPSPSAVVVLLGAAALGRAWFGVLLVVAYGVGMGGALTGIGLLLARFTDSVLHRLRKPWATALLAKAPMVTALLVLAGGLTATAWALLGIIRP